MVSPAGMLLPTGSDNAQPAADLAGRKHRPAVMFNAGGLAMQDLTCLTHVAAIGFHNRPVTQTDTDNRQFTAHTGQQLRHTARFTGAPTRESISTGFCMVARRSISVCAGTWLR